jgi:hypothetical protein
MTDVIMIATIVAFFVAAALLVQALGRIVADAADDADQEEAPERPLEPARPA